MSAGTFISRRAAASTMTAIGTRYRGRAGSREPPRNQTFTNPLRTAPERSRVHPFAFARLRMAVSERLFWRPIQARAISQTAFEAWGGLESASRARPREGCVPTGKKIAPSSFLKGQEARIRGPFGAPIEHICG